MDRSPEYLYAPSKHTVFIGQTSVDVYPHFDIESEDITDDMIILRCEGKTLTIKIRDPPLMAGGKRFASELFSLNGFDVEMDFGGGICHSHREYRQLQRENGNSAPARSFYFDPSIPSRINGKVINRILDEDGTDFFFGNQWEMPENLVIRGEGRRCDKKVVKNDTWTGKGEIDNYVKRRVREVVREADTVFINSGRTEEFIAEAMDAFREGRKQLFAVVTKSLSWEFVRREIMPYGTIITEYDELAELLGKGKSTNKERRIKDVFEWVKEMKRFGINERHDMHVTDGKNGMIVSDGRHIYHIVLKPGKCSDIQRHIERKPRIYGTCGAGDTYAGAVLYCETEEGDLYKDIVRVAKKAAMSAIKYIGYGGPLDEDMDFEIRRKESI